MENYLKFWRLFPRLTMGVLFFIALASAIAGPSYFMGLWKTFIAVDIQKFSGLLTSFLTVVALLILGTVGLSIMGMMIKIFGYFFVPLLRMFCFSQRLTKAGAGALTMSISELARAYFLEHEKDIMGYYYLKSWAQPEVLGQVSELETHTTRIAEHIKEIHDVEIIENFDYYHSVNQEQVLRDHMREDIDDVYHLMIVGALFLISCARGQLTLAWLSAGILTYIALVMLMIPILLKRKQHLASYVIFGYLDAFTLGQGSTVADREAL